jgi:uncharacterized OB-fold protein
MSDEKIAIRPFSSASFDAYLVEHRLMAARCTQCGGLYMPPRAICPKCHSGSMEWIETGGKGKLSAFTVIYSGPTFMLEQGFDCKHPYISGIVELDEGPRISARITGLDPTRPEEIKIGTTLRADFEDTGEGETRQTYLAFKA